MLEGAKDCGLGGNGRSHTPLITVPSTVSILNRSPFFLYNDLKRPSESYAVVNLKSSFSTHLKIFQYLCHLRKQSLYPHGLEIHPRKRLPEILFH